MLNGLTPGTEADYVARDLTPVLGSLRRDRLLAASGAAVRPGLGRAPAYRHWHVPPGIGRRRMRGFAEKSGPVGRHRSPLRDDASACPRSSHAIRRTRPSAKPSRMRAHVFRQHHAAWRTRRASSSARVSAATSPAPARLCTGSTRRQAATIPCGPSSVCVPASAGSRSAAGATVGYNATWTAARPSRIATASIGYADGWMRSLSGRGAASFDGRAVPLVGRVSMDLTTFDVTGCPGAIAGRVA